MSKVLGEGELAGDGRTFSIVDAFVCDAQECHRDSWPAPASINAQRPYHGLDPKYPAHEMPMMSWMQRLAICLAEKSSRRRIIRFAAGREARERLRIQADRLNFY